MPTPAWPDYKGFSGFVCCFGNEVNRHVDNAKDPAHVVIS